MTKRKPNKKSEKSKQKFQPSFSPETPSPHVPISTSASLELLRISKSNQTKQSYYSEQPPLKTVKYLQTKNNSIESLKQRYGINVKFHTVYKNLILLKYNMLISPMSSPIVQECRGLILDTMSNPPFAVVSYPYKKFFNYQEKLFNKKDIHWESHCKSKNVRVYQKIDGSLCVLYWYNGEWIVQSQGTPDGCGAFGKDSKNTFNEMFWDIWTNKLKYELPPDSQSHNVFIFEMISPRNKIVNHVEPSLPKGSKEGIDVSASCEEVFNFEKYNSRKNYESIVLHGVRDMRDFQEKLSEGYCSMYNWECTPFFTCFGSMEQVVEAANKLNCAHHEGFVVCDTKTFNRVKVKNPQYVCLSHLSLREDKLYGSLNRKGMLEIVRKKEGDEFLSYFEQYSKLYQVVNKEYLNFIECVKEVALKLNTGVLSESKVLDCFLIERNMLEAYETLGSKKKKRVVKDIILQSVEFCRKDVKMFIEYIASKADLKELYSTIYINTQQ